MAGVDVEAFDFPECNYRFLMRAPAHTEKKGAAIWPRTGAPLSAELRSAASLPCCLGPAREPSVPLQSTHSHRKAAPALLLVDQYYAGGISPLGGLYLKPIPGGG